jgi:hypothetical protein
MDSIPKRANFIYLNPWTQRLCGFAVGSPVLLFSETKVTIGVPWPVSKVPLDNVALSPVARTNCQVNLGDSICVSKLLCPVLSSKVVYLKPAPHLEDELPSEKVFINYLKHHLGE